METWSSCKMPTSIQRLLYSNRSHIYKPCPNGNPATMTLLQPDKTCAPPSTAMVYHALATVRADSQRSEQSLLNGLCPQFKGKSLMCGQHFNLGETLQQASHTIVTVTESASWLILLCDNQTCIHAGFYLGGEQPTPASPPTILYCCML